MYRPTIGLEIHAELKTRTKMFCDSANNPLEEKVNTNVCPICLAHPGTLPTINREAVRHILRIGAAIGGAIAKESEFDRKSYFYPDIPKGYQISQYQHPLVRGGTLADVAITRVHLEEDTARSTHAHGKSLIDFNRAGIPLMELVTEPVIQDAEAAGRFARELQLLLRALGASDANLEKGEMRIEANVSVAKGAERGTKVEIKNLNSFRSVERAIAYEVKRQSELLETGGEVVQETRGWDEAKQVTFHQRFKEGSADYRYFPEPDLPKLVLSEIPEFAVEALHASLPELPGQKRARYQALDISARQIETLLANERLQNIFEKIDDDKKKSAANYLTSDVIGLMSDWGEEGLDRITPEALSGALARYAKGSISSAGIKAALLGAMSGEGTLEELVAANQQENSEEALGEVVDHVLAEESKAVEEYKAGKTAALQYLVGKAMRASKGRGNPEVLRKLLSGKLSA